jgi:hypothetical protein
MRHRLRQQSTWLGKPDGYTEQPAAQHRESLLPKVSPPAKLRAQLSLEAPTALCGSNGVVLRPSCRITTRQRSSIHVN